jgi:hypothetical protein
VFEFWNSPTHSATVIFVFSKPDAERGEETDTKGKQNGKEARCRE